MEVMSGSIEEIEKDGTLVVLPGPPENWWYGYRQFVICKSAVREVRDGGKYEGGRTWLMPQSIIVFNSGEQLMIALGVNDTRRYIGWLKEE